MSAPYSSNMVAKVCLNEWGVAFFVIPASSLYSLNVLSIRTVEILFPYRLMNSAELRVSDSFLIERYSLKDFLHSLP